MNANELAETLELALEKDNWCQECGLENTKPIAKNAIDMLRQQAKEIEVLNQSCEILFKHRIEQEKESELLKANLRHVADQLRSGVSKIQQKTMARVIEECFGEKK